MRVVVGVLKLIKRQCSEARLGRIEGVRHEIWCFDFKNWRGRLRINIDVDRNNIFNLAKGVFKNDSNLKRLFRCTQSGLDGKQDSKSEKTNKRSMIEVQGNMPLLKISKSLSFR
jgi:hypothetical protein